MGRLIDADELNVTLIMEELYGNKTAIQVIDEAPAVDAIPKADYETRLKADLVAMLEILKQDLIAEAYGIEMFGDNLAVDVPDIEKVIQQKINKLKGVEDGKDN